MHSKEKRAASKRCQIIYQNTHSALNPRLTVKTILAEPLQVHRLPCPRERIRTMLEEVGLREVHAEAYPHQLSGGQRQRVNIARALALDPEIILCDEIVSALDVSVQSQILHLLRDIQKQRGMSLVFISHDLRVIRYMADDILVLKSGKIIESGSSCKWRLKSAAAHGRKLSSLTSQYTTIFP
jgi:peptide/nickel transport system ATP-binding protein/oligopeptide transport system ATP-binding protein